MKFLTWFGATSGKKRISISPAVVCSSATLLVESLIGRLSSVAVVAGAGVAGCTGAAAPLVLAVTVVSVAPEVLPLFEGEQARHAIASAVEISLIKISSSFVV